MRLPHTGHGCPSRRCTRNWSWKLPWTPYGSRKSSIVAPFAAIRDAVVDSLLAGLDAKGATIDDFRDPYGVSGSFQDQFLVHLREHQPCPNCGGPVRKLRAAGRGTYVGERCPPRPRAPRRARIAAG